MSLIDSIKQKKEIPFVEFMQLALYAPGEGYYSSGLEKFGRHGDFITAPELSPLFGKTLANQCQQILSNYDTPVIFEYGAGSGRLCVDILNHLEEVHSLPELYYILELSAHLRQRQQSLIQKELPKLFHKIQWLDQWPQKSFSGVILANEVLDAMPVHRFMKTEAGILESYISINEQGDLVEQFKKTKDTRLLQYIEKNIPYLPSPYLSEVNLFIDDWIRENFQILEEGAMIIIDYGFPQHEFYHPDRNQGTIMCHYQHHSHPNPLIHLGEQDITAHVDFTHVAEAAHDAGFQVAGYTNQASFLLSNGLLSLITNAVSERELLEMNHAVKQLTLPSEMGELFKVIALTKNINVPLNGFVLQDKRVSL